MDNDDDGPMFLEPRAMFDPAILGIARQFNRNFIVYDEARVLAIIGEGLELAPGDDRREIALEHYEFNVVGSWMGEGTPAFLNTAEIPSWLDPEPVA